MAEDKPQSFWNPFHKFETEKQALDAAKSGVVVAAIIAIGYVIFMALKVFANEDPYGGGDTQSFVVVDLVAITLAVFLGWRVQSKQALWASILLLLWVIAETVGKAALATNPDSGVHLSGTAFFVNIIGIIAAIASVRGCMRIGSLRKQARVAAASAKSVEASSAEMLFWQSIQSSSDPAEFEAYEQKFPNGVYVALARTRSAKLRGAP